MEKELRFVDIQSILALLDKKDYQDDGLSFWIVWYYSNIFKEAKQKLVSNWKFGTGMELVLNEESLMFSKCQARERKFRNIENLNCLPRHKISANADLRGWGLVKNIQKFMYIFERLGPHGK